jgi:hypothetical protein
MKTPTYIRRALSGDGRLCDEYDGTSNDGFSTPGPTFQGLA